MKYIIFVTRYKEVIEMAVSINKLPKEIQDKIINSYQNNMSLREIEKQYGAIRSTVSKFLEQKGIKTTKGNHYRKYFHDENFFEDINTEEKAYWLGFMYADGYIVNNKNRYGEDDFGITVAIDSLDIIEKFKSSLQATNPIRYDNSKSKGQIQAKLVCCSQKTVDDLIDKGVVKNKSAILKPPTKVPEELIQHFIRGFFDGDGSLIRHQLKNSNFIAFQVNFTTTYEMAIWLKQILQLGDIYPEKRSQFTWYYTIGGNQQVLKICHYMYDNAIIWMDRKYNRYKELLEKYDKSQGNNV